MGTCGASGCISAAVIAGISAAVMGCWALGYGIGKSVAWTRRLVSVA